MTAEANRTGSVLVVDDDPHLRDLVRTIFERAGWGVDDASNGRDALRALYDRAPDLILLDVGMEGLDGWATLTRVREVAETPVLMLTGECGELSKVRAFRGGADGYVTKPFGCQELLARGEALLRRSTREGPVRARRYDDGVVSIDFATRIVTVRGHEVALTPLEFRVLAAFARHPNHVLSSTQLLEMAWEGGVGAPHQVKIYVGYLRRKLGEAGALIETARGFGYRYRPQLRI